MAKNIPNLILAGSPEEAEHVPERPSFKLQTGDEISPKIDLQNIISEDFQEKAKHANPPAGKTHANPAAASGDVTVPTTAATTSATTASSASLNWADSKMAEVDANDGYTVVKGKKRRLGSTSPEHAARQPNKPGEQRSPQQRKRPTGPRAVPPQEIKATRANIADARARQATTNHENYVFVELCPDIPDYSYLKAMSTLLGGPKNITQFNRMNGHYIVGLANKDLANRLVADGLEIEGTTLKVFPFRKRAERIVVANLPGFVEDSTIATALGQFGRVTSIAPILVKMGEFTFTDGRREAFILLREGVRLETLPTRLTIQSKGDTPSAFLSFGIKCSKCGKQGHRRANCPALARQGNSSPRQAASPTDARSPLPPPQRPRRPAPAPATPASPVQPAKTSTEAQAIPSAHQPAEQMDVTHPAPAAHPASLAAPRPPEPRISPLDHEMSVEKLTSPPSTPARGESALKQLLKHIEETPTLSIDWDKLPGLNCKDAQQLLTSETTMKRLAPTLTEAQVATHDKLHDTFKASCPDSNSNIRKTLQKTRKARLARFVWGPDHTAWLPANVMARPVTIGGLGLHDLATQLQLACLKGVQVALRGGRNAFSWLVESGEAWIHPPPDGTRLQPRRLRLLKLWEEASNILSLNHRALPTAQLLDLPIIGGCRFLRPPDLLAPARWRGARVRDLIVEEHLIARPTRSALADAATLGAFCRRLTSENAVGFGAESTPSSSSLAAAVVLRGTATPFLNGLTTRSARRALDRPRLAATPISRFLARWTPTINPPSKIDWASLRRCAYSGHEADAALKLALHALPHPAHPASVGPSCPACGSIDRSLGHRYWCCRSIRPLIREAFNIIGRPPDLQAWIFAGSLEAAEHVPERPSFKLQTGDEISPKIDLQSINSENFQEKAKHANPPAGKTHANPAAASGDVTVPPTAATTIATTASSTSLNWADSEMEEVDANDGYTVVKGKKRRRGSTSPEHAARQPNKPGEQRSPQQRNRPTGPRAVPPQEIKATRANIADARARHATTNHENYVFVELCPDILDYSYIKAMSTLLGGPKSITQFNRMNGHYIVGLANKDLANLLVADGLEIEGTSLKVFPFRKRAERIVVANLPGFVKDSTIVNTLGQFGKVTSIAPILVKMGEFTFTDGRREAFILLREGVRLETLPTRLTIQSKGDTLSAFLSFGIKCSKFGKQGHRRANCPTLARQGNGSPRQAASPTDARPPPPPPPPQQPRKPAPAPKKPASPVQPAKTSTEAPAIPSAPHPAEPMDLAQPAPASHPSARPRDVGGEDVLTSRQACPGKGRTRTAAGAPQEETNAFHLGSGQDLCLGYSADVLALPVAISGSGLACVFGPGVAVLQQRILWPVHIALATIDVLEHLAGYIREIEEDTAHDDDEEILWDRWTTIKAGLLAEARSLRDPRHAASDMYICRARRYIAAQLEASSIRADYPSLPDLARAIRLRRTVSVIRDEQDNIIEGPELPRRAYATFQPRFARPTSDPAAGAAFIASSAHTTTRELSEEDPLHRPDISPSEIANAIEHLLRGKAPGSDGLPCELLVAFNEDFSAEALARVFAASRLRGALPPSWRRSSICLVLKARGGRGLDDYRPVALPSADYRVLAAILHRRLKPHLRILVPECQSYAVPGRSPSWNIAMVTAWINILYAGADATNRAGGFYTAAFPLLNGLRQGCAVSAALFSIATGPLLRRLELTLGVGNVTAYADDIILLFHPDEDFERVATVFEDYRQASGVGVNLRKSAGLWCGAWRNRGDSPLGASWSTTSIRILGLDIAPRSTVAHREQHLLALLETACIRWTPFTRGLSLVGRARAANTLMGSTIQHHLHRYLPSHPTIAKLQARLARFVWGPDHTACLPANVMARPFTIGILGLLDLATQLQLACLKGVQVALRGGRNAFSWLVGGNSGEAWIHPPPDGTRLQPRRLQLLKLWEEASNLLGLNHRAVPTAQLLDLPIIGGCRFLRPPDLLAPARLRGARVRDLIVEEHLIARPTRSALADAAALGAFCSEADKVRESHAGVWLNISREKFERLWNGLKTNTMLEHLSLANTGLTDSQAMPGLEDALHAHSTLRSLNVESNYLTGAAVRDLIKALLPNQSLLEVRATNQ
ncbi:TMOD1, partial [Cordylochernes scorpioides]